MSASLLTEEPSLREGLLTGMFGEGVVAVAATARHWNADLSAEERPYVERAVAKRRREFAAGRACAHEALERLGAQRGPLRVGPGREPEWPEGYIGSISHTQGACAAVVARRGALRGLGLDIERAAPLSAELTKRVCRPEELALYTTGPEPGGTSWPKLCFSAKEAFYKCYYPAGRTILAFEDVRITFGDGVFRARVVRRDAPDPFSGADLVGRWAVAGPFVVTSVRWLAP